MLYFSNGKVIFSHYELDYKLCDLPHEIDDISIKISAVFFILRDPKLSTNSYFTLILINTHLKGCPIIRESSRHQTRTPSNLNF